MRNEKIIMNSELSRCDILHGGTIPTFNGKGDEINGNPTTAQTIHKPRQDLKVKDRVVNTAGNIHDRPLSLSLRYVEKKGFVENKVISQVETHHSLAIRKTAQHTIRSNESSHRPIHVIHTHTRTHART
jgi:hypothetical protein